MSAWILPVLVAAFAVVALLVGRIFLKGLSGWLLVWMRGTCAFLCLGLFACSALVIYDLIQFKVASDKPVATVTIQLIDDAVYVAEIEDAQGELRHVTLEGDAWQLGIKAIQWGGLLKVLDGEPVYRLDSVASRYYAFEYSNRGASVNIDRSVWSKMLDSWTVFGHFEGTLRALGVLMLKPAAAFLPLADGAKYKVFYQRDTLSVSPVNMSASATIESSS